MMMAPEAPPTGGRDVADMATGQPHTPALDGHTVDDGGVQDALEGSPAVPTVPDGLTVVCHRYMAGHSV